MQYKDMVIDMGIFTHNENNKALAQPAFFKTKRALSPVALIEVLNAFFIYTHADYDPDNYTDVEDQYKSS